MSVVGSHPVSPLWMWRVVTGCMCWTSDGLTANDLGTIGNFIIIVWITTLLWKLYLVIREKKMAGGITLPHRHPRHQNLPWWASSIFTHEGIKGENPWQLNVRCIPSVTEHEYSHTCDAIHHIHSERDISERDKLHEPSARLGDWNLTAGARRC